MVMLNDASRQWAPSPLGKRKTQTITATKQMNISQSPDTSISTDQDLMQTLMKQTDMKGWDWGGGVLAGKGRGWAQDGEGAGGGQVTGGRSWGLLWSGWGWLYLSEVLKGMMSFWATNSKPNVLGIFFLSSLSRTSTSSLFLLKFKDYWCMIGYKLTLNQHSLTHSLINSHTSFHQQNDNYTTNPLTTQQSNLPKLMTNQPTFFHQPNKLHPNNWPNKYTQHIDNQPTDTLPHTQKPNFIQQNHPTTPSTESKMMKFQIP